MLRCSVFLAVVVSVVVADVLLPCPAGSCLRFGFSASLDGQFDAEGIQLSNGYQFWAETVNAQGGIHLSNGSVVQVSLLRYNDHSNLSAVAGLYRQLIADGADFLFGPFGSSFSDVANQVANSTGRVIVHGAAGDYLFTRGYKQMFGVSTTTTAYCTSILNVLYDAGARTVAMASTTVLFGAEVASGARFEIQKLGMTLVANVTFTPALASSYTAVQSILQQIANTGADVVMWLGLLADAELAVNASAHLGIAPKAFFLTSAPAQPDFVEHFGAASNYLLGPTQWFPTVNHSDPLFGTSLDFARNYQARFNDNATQIVAQGAAIGYTYQQALEDPATTDYSQSSVAIALHALNGTSFWGELSFGPNGRNLGKELYALQVVNERQYIVAPLHDIDINIVYPRPGAVVPTSGVSSTSSTSTSSTTSRPTTSSTGDAISAGASWLSRLSAPVVLLALAVASLAAL